MKLYKYLTFSNNYWSDPIHQSALYFTPVNELTGVNDSTEFRHTWNSNSYIFKTGFDIFKNGYDDLLTITRTHCLSKSLNEFCWKEFSKRNGLCYEFEFEKTKMSKEITAKPISYCKSKIQNVPDYLIKEIRNNQIGRILNKSKLDRFDAQNLKTTEKYLHLKIEDTRSMLETLNEKREVVRPFQKKLGVRGS